METLNDIALKYNITFSDNTDNLKDIILELFNNIDINENIYDLENPLILNILGTYSYINKNYTEMKKYSGYNDTYYPLSFIEKLAEGTRVISPV